LGPFGLKKYAPKMASTSVSIPLKEMYRGIWIKVFFKRKEKAHLNNIEVGRQ